MQYIQSRTWCFSLFCFFIYTWSGFQGLGLVFDRRERDWKVAASPLSLARALFLFLCIYESTFLNCSHSGILSLLMVFGGFDQETILLFDSMLQATSSHVNHASLTLLNIHIILCVHKTPPEQLTEPHCKPSAKVRDRVDEQKRVFKRQQ